MPQLPWQLNKPHITNKHKTLPRAAGINEKQAFKLRAEVCKAIFEVLNRLNSNDAGRVSPAVVHALTHGLVADNKNDAKHDMVKVLDLLLRGMQVRFVLWVW